MANGRTPKDSLATEKLLRAAETLFAQHGIEKASLRDITALAGVNVASVNYHFGSKDVLVEAVFANLAERVNDARSRALDELCASARERGDVASVEEIVQVFLHPYLAPNEQTHGELLAQFLLLNRMSPSPITTKIMEQHFDPMARKFISALGDALPGTTLKTLYWRYNFMATTVFMSVTDKARDSRVARLSGGIADPANRKELEAELIAYVAAAMRGPAPVAKQRPQRQRQRQRQRQT
ncbi:HTH-type transcriptional regulator BetI [Xylophilus ampelinus]|nr:HTH-type transcriptional regulator BetI [Xylophilus ampelinus]